MNLIELGHFTDWQGHPRRSKTGEDGREQHRWTRSSASSATPVTTGLTKSPCSGIEPHGQSSQFWQATSTGILSHVQT